MIQQLVINNNFMMKILSLVLFALISMNNALAQSSQVKVNSNIRKVQKSELKSDDFKKVYQYFQDLGFLKLPANYDKNFRLYKAKNKLIGVNPYPYSHLNNGQNPFFVNENKKKNQIKNDKETRISLFDETNGNYIMGVVLARSGGNIALKEWLVTFSFSGKVIDYIPIHEDIANACTTEAIINQDFTFDVYRIDFPGNDYIVKDHKPLDNLKGQRIDTKYQITPDGKFKKLSEVRYQPQIYSPEMLLDKTINIRERNEKLLNK